MIYLDNAATSWPKPEGVYSAVGAALRESCGNPGRSGHRLSLAAGRIVEEARCLAARLLGTSRPERVVFTCNATEALNLALKGALSAGDHVVSGSAEHNSVTRPIEALKKLGVQCDKADGADLDSVKASIRKNTRLMVFSHVSNVTGAVNPVAEIGALCRERGILFLVDAAQSAGTRPIDVGEMNIDLLAFPGHKGLLGPQGTGGLYIREGVDLVPLKEGGTGTRSESPVQPEALPFRYESGTHNTPGLAGLAAGLKHALDAGVGEALKKEARLVNRLIGKLSSIEGILLYGPPAGPDRSGVVSLNIEGVEPAEAALALDGAFDIAVRAGLHCAPDAHAALGTLERGGTVRVSIGGFNTEDEIDRCAEALASLAGEGRR